MKGNPPSARNLKHIAFFPGIGVAFNRIQKNGNSTAISFLHYLEHGEYQQSGHAKASALSFGDLGARGVHQLKLANRIVVVRDPYSRTLSGFLHTFGPKEDQRNSSPFESNQRGFRDFLSFLEEGGLHANKHWSPQTDRILLPLHKYDAVVPFSSFPHTFVQSLEGWVPSAREKWVEFSRRGAVGPPATNALNKLAAFYSHSDLETIERLYKKDFAVPQIGKEAERVRNALDARLSGC